MKKIFLLAASIAFIGHISLAQSPTELPAIDRTTPEYIKAKIVQTAKNNHIRPALALAVAEIENHFRVPNTRKEPKIGDHSVGIFQILTMTARRLGFTGTSVALKDPDVNIHYGIKYLKVCQDKFGQDVGKVACCYNAGEYVRPSVCENNLRSIRYQEDVSGAYDRWKVAGI